MKKENELDSTYGISDEELTERFKASIEIDRQICKISFPSFKNDSKYS